MNLGDDFCLFCSLPFYGLAPPLDTWSILGSQLKEGNTGVVHGLRLGSTRSLPGVNPESSFRLILDATDWFLFSFGSCPSYGPAPPLDPWSILGSQLKEGNTGVVHGVVLYDAATHGMLEECHRKVELVLLETYALPPPGEVTRTKFRYTNIDIYVSMYVYLGACVVLETLPPPGEVSPLKMRNGNSARYALTRNPIYI